MHFEINTKSKTPLYKQVINAVKEGIADGSIKNGEMLPSLNSLAAEAEISMETAKKAYNIMKSLGLISGMQGKGFFIDYKAEGAPKKVIIFLDSLTPYKLKVYRGVSESLNSRFELTIKIFNHDILHLERMVSDSLGNYDYYIVAPHFTKEVSDEEAVAVLKKIPNDRLIVIDKDIPLLKGKIGRVYQDFRTDSGKALSEAKALLSKYSSAKIIVSNNSLYSSLIIPSLTSALDDAGLPYSIYSGYEKGTIKLGVLYIVLDSMLDEEHFAILRDVQSKGYTLGREVGLVSYNDNPVNEFICSGLSSLSTDFELMGRQVAEMINSGVMSSIHNPFSLIRRNSM